MQYILFTDNLSDLSFEEVCREIKKVNFLARFNDDEDKKAYLAFSKV